MWVECFWGWYEMLIQGDNYLVKWLLVCVGQQLLLQWYCYCSESWIVVFGLGVLYCGDIWYFVSVGVMFLIFCGVVYCVCVDGLDLLILEVQYGDDLWEDDIEWLQDDYGWVIN